MARSSRVTGCGAPKMSLPASTLACRIRASDGRFCPPEGLMPVSIPCSWVPCRFELTLWLTILVRSATAVIKPSASPASAAAVTASRYLLELVALDVVAWPGRLASSPNPWRMLFIFWASATAAGWSGAAGWDGSARRLLATLGVVDLGLDGGGVVGRDRVLGVVVDDRRWPSSSRTVMPPGVIFSVGLAGFCGGVASAGSGSGAAGGVGAAARPARGTGSAEAAAMTGPTRAARPCRSSLGSCPAASVSSRRRVERRGCRSARPGTPGR